MGVQLNIKDEHTVRLARHLAERSGKSVTETIRDALESAARATEEERERRLLRARAILNEIHANIPEDMKALSFREVMDSIYDDDTPDGFAR